MAEIKDKLNDLKLQLAGMKERLHVEFRINLEDILDEATNKRNDRWKNCRKKQTG